eukprot:CAMPEP_0195131884 /NCGR_PEP_ID=MMETSP0448-20130528/145911_1 /TAXON_ID=66468 /ORGANISM="Heterocapsa triquestra, Strain CCMP 448" /LENGTH=347 /DNA_ID=CAMNT_0040169865 /DNA_START=23 /DNA_END=1066 /DNA_ORIENTATION=-
MKKGLHSGPGAWAPSLSAPVAAAWQSGLQPVYSPDARGGRLPRQGPTNLDLEAKAALQKMLRPSNLNVIGPFLQQASLEDKKDVVRMERQLAACEREAVDARRAPVLVAEEVVMNPHGRQRLAKSVPVTADRAQSDLLRNRHGADQRDTALHAKRKFFSDFAPVPSTASVDDFFRLGMLPAESDAVSKVLTEWARKRLQQWQTRGPERSREGTACVMRALRCIHVAVSAVPTYSQHSVLARPGAQGYTDSLHDYTFVRPDRNMPNIKPQPRTLAHSLSAPTVLRPYLDPGEIEGVRRPGGYILDLKDKTMVQTIKNRERGTVSKMASLGGQTDWSTTYEAHNKATWS